MKQKSYDIEKRLEVIVDCKSYDYPLHLEILETHVNNKFKKTRTILKIMDSEVYLAVYFSRKTVRRICLTGLPQPRILLFKNQLLPPIHIGCYRW